MIADPSTFSAATIKPSKLVNFLPLLIAAFLSAAGYAQQPQSPLVRSFQEHLWHQEQSIYGLNWIPLGPVGNSALVEAFQVDMQHPGTIYLGFGSGSLWKTTNNGLSWKPIFDKEASYSVGDFALAPSNTSIIYLGTGETLKKPRNFTMPGTGMYRSDDGGETWRHLGLDDSWHIAKVVVHPTNPDIVYVAVLGHLWTTNPHREFTDRSMVAKTGSLYFMSMTKPAPTISS
ncbi:glycosyl hydrolase [Mariniradius saccharolyticus AK6]|uniref:Glycosyl hydrolase n=1 Tax=Mariniradius saccharolyticus AK6 TaxID=1239962 RepID=M7X1N1_9BACT|nr:glycosyl hydrolase [Mariniradius saccharolyticus]EMS31380.1 glycosyl hydrolase [Mariniradius saccharolyticus AK6]